jgi:hypothetical protein
MACSSVIRCVAEEFDFACSTTPASTRLVRCLDGHVWYHTRLDPLTAGIRRCQLELAHRDGGIGPPTSVGSEPRRWPGVSPRLWALHADRDIVSAAPAACVELDDRDDPRTARVDYQLAHALKAGLAPQQERQGSVNRRHPPSTIHHPVASAEHAAPGPPPNRPGPEPGRRGSIRKQLAPKLIGAHDPQRVNSW